MSFAKNSCAYVSTAICITLLGACLDDEIVFDDEEAVAEEAGEDPEDQEELADEPEPCETWAGHRSCDEDEGMQFCAPDPDPDSNELVWGACMHSYECVPGEERECLAGSVACQVDITGEPFFPECPFTPLVLAFDREPELSTNAASFPMDGPAGMCQATDWPSAETPWLAVDLDGNGSIDGGAELFGSGSVMPGGRRADNGFIALAPFDSNGDRIVDAADDRFSELLVWRDVDGDKRSAPTELTRLADEGVAQIELAYQEHAVCDARGNCGRERASFLFERGGKAVEGEVVDLHLPCW